MSNASVLAPVFVQALLAFVLLLELGRRRRAALEGKQVRRDGALREEAWPDHVTQASNAVRNQFEVPVLFYLFAMIALVTKQADGLIVGLAWIFVVTRWLHAFVHVTSNTVRWRFLSYFVGVLALMVMWAVLAARVLLA